MHCHAQMYTMASILRHGSEEQKRRTLPRIADGSLRLQAGTKRRLTPDYLDEVANQRYE